MVPTRFYGSLSVYSRPLPSEKIAHLQPCINLKLCKYRCAKKEKTRQRHDIFEVEGFFFCNITKLGFFFTHFQIILNKQKYLI